MDIEITLSDRWHTLTKHGLRIGSPDVGMSRVQLIGDAATWEKARAAVASCRGRSVGASKASATAALRRIEAALPPPSIDDVLRELGLTDANVARVNTQVAETLNTFGK